MASTINAITTGAGGIVTTGDSTGALALQTNNGTTAMTIDTSQNVGIGTTGPNVPLDVQKDSTTTYSATTDQRSQAKIVGRNASELANYFSSISLVTGGGNQSEWSINNVWSSNYVGNLAFKYRTGSTTWAEAMRIDTSGYITNGANGNSAGLVQGSQYYRLNSTYAGSNVNTAQSVFGVGVTLVGSTVYEFEIVVGMIKTAGATSHTISLLFGGTATLNNIGYNVTGSLNATASYAAANLVVYTYQSASASQATTSAGVAGLTATIIAKGTVSVNAGGTFIPQYQLSAAPGGAYTTQIGSYVKISPLSASGANTSIGSWA